MIYLGVDGCKAGWFSVAIYDKGEFETGIFTDIESLFKKYGKDSFILIDIPIGLVENGSHERECDPTVRKLLGQRRSSVFPAPCRKAIYANSYTEACRINEENTEKKISLQTWGIIPKIREVNEFILKNRPQNIKESHPEVCFLGLSGSPMQYNKKEGFSERKTALISVYARAEDIIKHALASYRRRDVFKDDILDALSLAVAAFKGKNNLASIPEKPQYDTKGIPMEIVYWKHLKRG